MFQNYLTTAIRNLVKARLYSAINILGLAIGLAAALMIFLFVQNETSYEQWITDRDDIYRVHSTFTVPGRPIFKTVNSAGGLMWDMPDKIPEIEDFTRLMDIGMVGQLGDNNFNETMTFVDPTFFDVFNLTMIEGDRETAFKEGNSIIISRDTAYKYFGDKPALGEVISFCCVNNENVDLKVSGVFENIPLNSHMELQIVTPIVREWFSAVPWMLESHTSVNVKTYFKLKQGTDPAVVKSQIDAHLNSTYPVETNDMGIEKTTDYYNLALMNISDIHLNAREQASDLGDMRPLGDLRTVYAFSGVAILIIMIASINFMNLSTARSAQRAREVSLRKVLGAERRQLILQFLGESILITFIALALALAFVELAMPLYNQTLDKELSLTFFGPNGVMIEFLILGVVIGILSGLYPAFILSGFRPARILKANKSVDAEGSVNLRNVLVVFQFAISIGLATVTAIIYGQSLYAKSADLGFARENKVILRGYDATNLQALKNDLVRLDGVTAAVGASEVPTENRENNRAFSVKGSDRSEVINYRGVDYGFFETYGVDLMKGRFFSKDYGTDLLTIPDDIPEDETRTVPSSAILNSVAARKLGFDNPEDAVGNVISARFGRANIEFEVIGVINPIQYRSLRYGFHPVIYFNQVAFQSRLTVQVTDRPLAAALADIERVWKVHNPRRPFNYQILDDLIARQYAAEDTQFEMFGTFSMLAILIACLGLFGLAAFSVNRKTKEIGIRKVMGAQVRDIIRLMLWQFSKPIIWASVIALPLTFWYMMDWLMAYEHRIGFSFVAAMGLISAVAALTIAWVTVASHATKVAHTNPIKALRFE